MSSASRVKRVAEYTRWRVDPLSTKEFIVKVLDDEPTKPPPKITYDVNINEDTKIMPLDVAHMNAHRMKSPSKTPEDYTRFIMPTTIHTGSGATKQSYFEEFALKAQKPLRDESPPSGPEFIERIGPAPAPRVQVAPLAPIAFPRRTAYEAPLTPPQGPKHIPVASLSGRTDVQPHTYSMMLPTRTTTVSEFFSNFMLDDTNDSKLGRHPLIQGSTYSPYRTPSMQGLTDLSRTASLEPVALTRTSSGENKKDDFYFRRFQVEDENKNPQSLLEESESFSISHEPQSKDINKHQNTNNIHRTESPSKDYDSNYNLMNDADDFSVSKKTDFDEESSEDIKIIEDNSSEEANEEFISNGDVKEQGPQRTTVLPMSGEVPPRTSTVKPDETKVDVYDTEPENVSTTDIVNIKVFQKVPEPEGKGRSRCDLSRQLRSRNEFPRSLGEIYEQLKKWILHSPIAHLLDITNGNLTVMDNPIYLVIVDDPSVGQALMAKHTVMILAGIGARDHHAVAAAMEMLRRLIEETDENMELLIKYRFFIIPVFNPDGYEYSIGLPHRRNWVKNLRQYWDECRKGKGCEGCQTYGLRCTLKPCYGVNLDRNFEYQWIPDEELEAEHPCGPLYAGERQLSEPETQALATFMQELTPPLYAFIAFKEGEVLGVMYPYSHTKNKRQFDQNYRKNASRAANAAASVMGRSFVAGQTSEFLPLYAGGVEDWVDGHLGLDRVYSMLMFRPTDYMDRPLSGLTLSFERVGREAFAAVVSLLMPTKELSAPPASPTTGPLGVPQAPPVIMAVATAGNGKVLLKRKEGRDSANTCSQMFVLVIVALMCLEFNKTYLY